MQAFDEEPGRLKEMLLTMASHAESSVYSAIEALDNRDYNLALRVQGDDAAIDRYEVEVDELAIQLLGRGLGAQDLRLVTVAMKISQNLERVGDETTTIARRVQELCQEAPLKLELELPRMAALATQMLKRALDAFVKQDAAAARAVIPEDKQVDLLNKQNQQELTDRMMKDPESVRRCLGLLVISKSLERIADHAKNVAEEVVYLCEARDIRHAGAHEPLAGGARGVTEL